MGDGESAICWDYPRKLSHGRNVEKHLISKSSRIRVQSLRAFVGASILFLLKCHVFAEMIT